jgi:hypothetical protein
MTVQLPIGQILELGAVSGTRDIGELLIPFMTHLSDIRGYIVRATEAHNAELAEFWIGWQQEHRPLSLDDVFLASIRSCDLEILRSLGIPSADLNGRIAELAVRISFLGGLQYAFGFMSRSEKQAFVLKLLRRRHRYRSYRREITSFLFAEAGPRPENVMVAVTMCAYDELRALLSEHTTRDCVNFITAGGTPLCVAAAQGDGEVIRILLSTPGIDAMRPDLAGNSPFVLACRHSSMANAIMIADFCGDDLATDYYQLNAGFVCACRSRPSAEQSVMINFFSRFFSLLQPNLLCGSTSAFISASTSGNSQLLQWLLTFPDLDVNHRDRDGSTALMAAVASGATPVFSFLLMMLGLI